MLASSPRALAAIIQILTVLQLTECPISVHAVEKDFGQIIMLNFLSLPLLKIASVRKLSLYAPNRKSTLVRFTAHMIVT